MSNLKRFKSKWGLDGNGLTIENVLDPVNLGDVATKNYTVTYYQPLDAELTGLAAIGTNGIVAKSAAGTFATRTILGTANQIAVNNGDGISGNPSIAIADNPTLTGTEKYTWPSGTSAQRPASPVNGDSRFNSDLGYYEQYYNGSWYIVPRTATLGAVQARRTTTYVTTTTATDLTFDTVDVATDTNVCNRDATNTNRFVAYESGTYEFLVSASSIASNTASIFILQFKLNDITVLSQGSMTQRPASTTSRDEVATMCLVNLAANDYITVQAFHTSNSVTIQIGASVTMKKLEGTQGDAGAMGGSNAVQYAAASLESPNTANWAVNATAPLISDATNTALSIRAFDDTAVEGVGGLFYVPPTATSINFVLVYRAATAPATAKAVIANFYYRTISINAAIGAWSSATALSTINIPTNAYYQYFTQTITLASLGITAGTTIQFELTRNGASVSDTLVGDYYLLTATFAFL